MAKGSRKKTETRRIGGILGQLAGKYAEAESMRGGGFWRPDPRQDPYPGYLSSFKLEQGLATRDKVAYDQIVIGITIDDEAGDDSDLHGKETFQVFKTLPSKKDGVLYGLARAKGLTEIINEGEPIDDLEACLAILRKACDDGYAVWFRCSQRDVAYPADIQVTDLRDPGPGEAEGAEVEEEEEPVEG